MQQRLHTSKPLQLAGKPGESSRQFQILENFGSFSPIAWFLWMKFIDPTAMKKVSGSAVECILARMSHVEVLVMYCSLKTCNCIYSLCNRLKPFQRVALPQCKFFLHRSILKIHPNTLMSCKTKFSKLKDKNENKIVYNELENDLV